MIYRCITLVCFVFLSECNYIKGNEIHTCSKYITVYVDIIALEKVLLAYNIKKHYFRYPFSFYSKNV